MVTHLLFESASGYAIFEVKLAEDIGSKSREMQESIKDLGKFGKMVQLLSFSPFKTAAQALENINDISEGAFGISLTREQFIEVLAIRYSQRFTPESPGVEPVQDVEKVQGRPWCI
jgi:hypothetical protein